MMQIRRSHERGHADHGWLQSAHTFSFANYYDPAHMGFRALRVINEDHVAPGEGFGRHPHRDMEIITHVLSGEVAHEDSTGRKGVISPGQVQVMSAGSGIYHSEMNPSSTTPVHLLQIWILPARKGVQPRYEDRDFSAKLSTGQPTLLASPDGRDGSLPIGQDALLIAHRPAGGTETRHPASPLRHFWVQVAKGSLEVNGERLEAGDGAALSSVEEVAIKALEDSEYLLFDLN